MLIISLIVSIVLACFICLFKKYFIDNLILFSTHRLDDNEDLYHSRLYLPDKLYCYMFMYLTYCYRKNKLLRILPQEQSLVDLFHASNVPDSRHSIPARFIRIINCL